MLIAVADRGTAARDLLDSHLRRWGYDTVLLETGSELLERLGRLPRPRIVLLRWDLGDDDPSDLCRQVRASEVAGHAQVIAMADRGSCHHVLGALADGLVDDCLLLPLDAYALELRLALARKTLTLRQRLAQTEEGLEAQSMKDGLTEVWSRSASLAFLRRELIGSRRDKSSVGVALLAIRGLDAINRHGGHEAGDQVLRDAASALRTAVRTTDWTGRYSGGTFILVLPGCGVTRVESVAGRLARAVDTRLADTAAEGYQGLAYAARSSAGSDLEVDALLAAVQSDLDHALE